MPRYHLAQLNIGRVREPLDSERLAGFMARLDEINGLAERSPGFVWRLQSDAGNATDIRVDDDPLVIVNLTVWESIEDLHAFAYRSEHKAVFASRSEWFERWEGPSVCLWWQLAGTIPDVQDARRRLRHLAANGPSSEAFTFKQPMPRPPDAD